MASDQPVQNVPASGGMISPAIAGLVAFVFIIVSVFLALSYELFIYRGYQSLYKQGMIGHLARESTVILALKDPDSRKLELFDALGRDYLKNPGLMEVWIADKDTRLIYSSNPDVLRAYKFQKLPAQYFKLYQNGFNLTANQYLPVLRNDMDPQYAYIVQAIRSSKGETFSHTVGMKIMKKNFFMKPFPVSLPGRTTLLVPSTAVGASLLFLVLCFTGLITLLYAYNTDRIKKNHKGLTSEFCRVSETGDLTGIQEMKLTGSEAELRDSTLEAVRSILARKDKENSEKENTVQKEKEHALKDSFIDTVIRKPDLQMKGLTYSLYHSSGSVRSKNLVLIKELSPFSYVFLVTHQLDADAKQQMLTASFIYSVFSCFSRESTSEAMLSEINQYLITNNIPSMQALAGIINLTDNTLRLSFAGYRSLIHFNSRTREAEAYVAPGLALGKAVSNDLLVAMKQEKFQLSTDDVYLFFNPDLVEHGISVDGLKGALADNYRMTAENILPTVMNMAVTGSDQFFFVLKKT